MSRLGDGAEKFGAIVFVAMFLYMLVFLPLLMLGVFEWKLFHSTTALVQKQTDLCVADKNTEVELLELEYLVQELFGSNEAEVLRGIIVAEIQTELEISEEGFKALSLTEKNT